MAYEPFSDWWLRSEVSDLKVYVGLGAGSTDDLASNSYAPTMDQMVPLPNTEYLWGEEK